MFVTACRKLFFLSLGCHKSKKVGSHWIKRLILEAAKKLSILLDPIPGVADIRIDQMAFVRRYVKIDSGGVQIKEPFLNFFPLYGKSSKEITQFILDDLQENVLDGMICKCQTYDNASTMIGIYY